MNVGKSGGVLSLYSSSLYFFIYSSASSLSRLTYKTHTHKLDQQLYLHLIILHSCTRDIILDTAMIKQLSPTL